MHATLVKRGRAVAHCSLEDIQASRVLEVPLWMLDVVACCKTRVSQPGFASAQSLRELKEVRNGRLLLLHTLRRVSALIPRSPDNGCLNCGLAW